ncbi:MAG: thiamine phosphate synthase [Methanosarcinaceae archaeon]|nr:thiamine phosphate synthase [Methanosarcinaceae archaeon]
MSENLYALNLITDRFVCKGEFYSHIESALKGGVTLLQYREKNMSSKDMYYDALNLKKIADKYDCPLVVNDRLDIALAVNAGGLHVGQSDLPASVARELLGPDKILGVSASSVKEAKEAELAGANYIGVGAMYPTSSKEDPSSVTFDELLEITNSVSIPVLAIGGVKSENISDFKGTGISGVAVISDIMGADDPENRSRQIIENLKRFVL